MCFMNQNSLPSLGDISRKVVLNNYAKILCILSFKGPNPTTAPKQRYILGNPKRVFRLVHKSDGFGNRNKVLILVKKEGFNSNRLKLRAKKETEELRKMQLTDVNTKSVDVVTSFDLKPYRKPHAKKECVTGKFQSEELLGFFFDFSFLTLQILMDFFQQLPINIPRSFLKQFCKDLIQETLKYAMGLLMESLLIIILKLNIVALMAFQSKAKTVELGENSEKPAGKKVSSTLIKAETQVSVNLPDKISSKPVQSCCACSEPIWKKKFFDERRFGILEKCKCIICYGCLRTLTRATDRVVKGPVKCPICNLRSDNVASSSNWIKDEDKEQFFKEYCKNVQNTDIKMRLGWTSFNTRKDNLWTRAL